MLHSATDKARALGRAGSYWYSKTSERSKELFRTLTRSAELINAPYQLQALSKQLVGGGAAHLPYQVVKFELGDVTVVGRDIHEKMREELQLDDGSRIVFYRLPDRRDGGFRQHMLIEAFTTSANNALGAESCQFLAFADPGADNIRVAGSDWAVNYLVAIPFGVCPSGVLTPSRNLVAGVDFFVSDGCLLFQEDPYSLFPDGFMTLMGCSTESPNLFDFTYGVDPFYGDGAPVADFQRRVSAPSALERAAAVAAGLTVSALEGYVVRRLDHCQGSRYVLKDGVVDVPYKHARKAVGEHISAGEVMGGGIKLHWQTNGPGWHRALDWSAGLDLGSLCPVVGINIPDRVCPCWVDGFDGSKLFARFDLGNSASAETAFWAHVRASEVSTGLLLNAAIGLSDPGDVKFLNPLDFYFEQYFNQSAIVAHVRLRGVSEDKRRRALAFLQAERLIGTLLFVKDDPSDVSDESLDSSPALSYLLRGGDRYINTAPPFAV